MLPDIYRLKRKKDFEILFKMGKFIPGNIVNLKIWKIDTEKYPRRGYSTDDLKIGFVIGLRISKKAVERNQVKRKMREVVRLLIKDGKIKKGYLMAFIAKEESLNAGYTDIENDIMRISSGIKFN